MAEGQAGGIGAKKQASVSTSESRFQHADHGVLLRDDLGLPHKNDGHDAHRKDTKGQDNPGLRFRCRDMKSAANPIHG